MEQTKRGRTAWAISLTACLILTSWAAPGAASQSWTTEPDFEIGAGPGPGGNGGFSRVGSVRVSRDGARVHVVEPLASRVTVWSPSGELILRLEREGPLADFGRPHGVRLLPDGFWATYDRHFVRFSDDGAVLEVVQSSVTGAGVVSDNHGILARGRLPRPAVILGWVQGETGHELAVLHYAGNGGYRTADTIALMDVGRMALGIRFDDGTSPYPEAMVATQPFTDSDLSYFDGDRESVGIVRRNGAPGQVVVTEITARGDTVWRRSLALPPVPIRAEQVEEAVRDLASRAVSSAQRLGRPISEGTARRLATEALYVPEHLPAVAVARATNSDELWLRSHEVSDTLSIWYALHRRDDAAEPRRVLLPEWFQLLDATRTHVWGLRSESENRSRVVGRRLVPMPSP